IFGPLSDTCGRKKVALFIISICALASLLAAFTASMGVFLTLRPVPGLTAGSASVMANATMGDQHEGKAFAKGLASLLVINGIITISAPIIGGYALTISNWKAVFVILTIVSVIILFLSIRHLEETHQPNRAKLNFKVIF